MTDQHKHCPMCGTPIPLSEKFCSPKCEQVYQDNQSKVNRTRRILYVAFAVFILIWLYYMIIR